MKFNHFIGPTVTDIWYFENFANMEDIERKCNPIVDLWKFTFNKKILSRIVATIYNQVCSQILSYF